MSDDEKIQDWVDAARRGDEQGFIKIYRSYSGKVRGLLRQMIGAEGLDDQVQEVFLRVWKGLGSLRETAAFSGWIYRMTWNVAMDSRKSAALQRTQTDEFVQFESLSSQNVRPENSLDAKLVVEKALKLLDLEHRGVVVLVDLEDFTLEKAASIMNIPIGTVKSRLHNARERLKNHFAAEGVAL